MSKNSNPILFLLIPITIIIFSVYSCMESNQPDSEGNYNLTVRVIQIDPTQPNTTTPLANVNVKVNPSDGSAQQIEQITDFQGIARFTLHLPIFGKNFDIIAQHNNRFQIKSNILICRDTLVIFVFDTSSIPSLDCNIIGSQDSVIFIDDNFSRELQQNTPLNTNYYTQCKSFINLSQNQETLLIRLPQLNSNEFFISSISINGNLIYPFPSEINLAYGQVLTICFGARTNVTPNIYNYRFIINVTCDNQQQQIILDLNSKIVAPTCTCDDIRNNVYEFNLTQRVEVGTSTDHQENVFTNNTTCMISVSQESFEGNNAWSILFPSFPLVLKPGESLNLRARFSPKNSIPTTGILRLKLRFDGTTQDCPFEVRLNGNGCSPACPLISKTRSFFRPFGTRLNEYIDTLSNRDDRRVLLRLPGQLSDQYTSAAATYYILNPDTACNEIIVNLSVTPQDADAARFFRVSPSILRLAPGEIGAIEVTFISPTFDEFTQIYQRRGGQQRLIDSLFKIVINLTSLSCNHRIEDIAVVSKYPDISPIINLRAYAQRTPQKSEPENEVYFFGALSRTILKTPDGQAGPYPPDKGDIWVDVLNNNPSANPPQEPILKSVNNTIGMKIWQRNYIEEDFSKVFNVYNQFMSDPNHSLGYSTAPLTGLQVGDVVAFKLNNFVYALIYIRRIDNGTENTSSKQSGIEFRSIFPIVEE